MLGRGTMTHASYAEKGLKVFPVYEIKDGICACKKGESCGDPGKHPGIRGGFLSATDDREKIAKWLKKCPDANIGIRTGAESGIFVVDDDGNEGRDNLEALQMKYGELPDTWKARTGRGGHRYFKHPGDIKIQCSTSQIAHKIDIKGDGGYVVAPPSVHILGKRYEWEEGFSPDDMLLADAPGWLIKRAIEPQEKKVANGNKVSGEAEEGFIYESRPSRNLTLLARACHMRDKGVSRKEIREYIELLNEHRCKPALP